ncbi:MAG: pyruvate, phosphate dikinase [Myxococcales bacterium]|nr:pyruvate, phosphate dikinase [Myxococcales bacterium]
MSEKWVYRFDEGDASMKGLLGGKGANLAEMSRMGLPVPPGFTITTRACNAWLASGGQMPEGLMDQVQAALADVEAATGKRLGDPDAPLLLSVRSGARFSMPGMMDTVLNLGLNRDTLGGLIRATGDERFGYDANRRFVMMFSDVVLGLPKARFEQILTRYKRQAGVKEDTQLGVTPLKALCNDSLALVLQETGAGFPGDPMKQLVMAIEAVFQSWNNERAVIYRRRERIPDDLGTAVNIQAMVFGNLGLDSGSGVAFTRDPATGERALYGEYLMNAQGEDVVAGVRTPHPIADLRAQLPKIHQEFQELASGLEQRFRDMMDLEFTIERGRLYVLQCRVGKRTGPAAVRMAVEMVDEGLIDAAEAVRRVTSDQLDQLLHPRIDPHDLHARGLRTLATGIPASPGAAVGQIVFDADAAEAAGKVGRPVILVREETSPDDVHGMLGAKGILTARGGKTSHAAVVARGFGVPCVVGCEALHVDHEARTLTVRGEVLAEGAWLTLDGSDGRVFGAQLALIAPEIGGWFGRLMGWCDEFRRLEVRANADNPRDARQAVAFGAQGVGLCRTEHMFFETDRLPIVRALILADSEDQRRAALQKLQTVQQADFEGIFEAMAGRPVTIRLLDPPLHEFLPAHDELLAQVIELRLAQNLVSGRALAGVLAEKETQLAAVEAMREQNPMLGLRGVRLSLVMPGIAEMQTRAVVKAALKVRHRGLPVHPEIMVPLVGHPQELARVRAAVEAIAAELLADAPEAERFPLAIGTMIEVPRAALQAGAIAGHADFFSFGTNDLTQMTFGLSRDDAGRFLSTYVEKKILPDDPFETLDQAGVGRLMQLAVTEGRAAKPGLKCGICGEHGGDPRSITFCHDVGLDYVSCSPFRVPVARLAAAQAALAGGHEDAAR